jgi:hypothetical protein
MFFTKHYIFALQIILPPIPNIRVIRDWAQQIQMKLHYQGTQSLATLVTDGVTSYSETQIQCL